MTVAVRLPAKGSPAPKAHVPASPNIHLILSDELAPGLPGHLERISALLAELVPRGEFHHIGATAIPGSLTKGDVDVVLRVEAADFQSAADCLRRHFAINQPENWTSAFASFADDHSFPFPLGVQLVIRDSDDDFFLFLIEYFTASPEHLAEYNRIKLESAPLGMAEYRNAKDSYLAPIIASRPKRTGSGPAAGNCNS